MASLGRDLRYALRGMQRNRGFTVVAIVSLSVGIGAYTAVYSIYSTVFQDTRGVATPEEIVLVDPGTTEDLQTSYPEYLEYRARAREVFTDLMAYKPNLVLLMHGEASEMVLLEEVSGNYFDLLGVAPTIGRPITAEDDKPGSPPAAVVSYQCWQRRFNGDAGVLGRVLKLNGHSFTVVGVAPPDFYGMFPFSVDLWTPIHQHHLLTAHSEELMDSDRVDWNVRGRLRAGVTLEQAGAVVRTVASQLAEDYPSGRKRKAASVLPSSRVAIVPDIDQPIRLLSWFLMGLVGLTIAIASTNLASILLARAVSRRREIGIRLALGAGRWRLTRQLLVESILLSLLGGIAGLLVAHWLIRLLLAIRPPLPLEINLQFGLNASSLAVALLVSLATGVVFGLLPAGRATNPNLVFDLKDGMGKSDSFLRRLGIQNGLVIVQVAASSVLLLCAALFLRSLGRAADADLGFDIRRGVIFELPMEHSGQSRDQALGFVRDLRGRLASLPGVESVTVAGTLPLGLNNNSARVFPVGSAEPVGERGVRISFANAGPEYFRTMGIALLQGRGFEESDLPGSPLAAVVNQSFAARFWPGESPLGRQFRLQADPGAIVYTVVGMARDGKYGTLGEDQQPFFYRASYQRALNNDFQSFVVRSSADPIGIVQGIRSEIRLAQPDLPVFNLRTVSDHLATMLFIPKLVGGLAVALGLVVLLLGLTGLYGVVAYDVSRRTHEVGIRMALGSTPGDIVRLILSKGMRLVVPGLLLGLLLAGLASRGLTALLIGVSPLDPISFITVSLLLIAVAAVSMLLPAGRAARRDPLKALRTD